MSRRLIVLVISDVGEDLRGAEELAKHLKCHSQSIDVWHRGLAEAGTDAHVELRRRAGEAALVVFLMSADLASDERWTVLCDDLERSGPPLYRVGWRACSPDRWARVPAIEGADGPLWEGGIREPALQKIAAVLVGHLERQHAPSLPPLPRPLCAIHERELEEIVARLGSKPVAVLGPLGIGKTSLALRAAHAATRDGVGSGDTCIVNCLAATSVDGILSLIAAELEMPLGVSNRQAWVSRALKNRLLLLYGAYRVWDLARDDVEKVLEQLAQDTAGRLILTLRGRESPIGWARVPLSPLNLEQSRELFFALLVDEETSFASDPHLENLLLAMGGLPRALVLLARRAQCEPDLSSVWADWQQRGASSIDNLDSFMAGALRTLRLTEGARSLLGVLAWLPGGLLGSEVEDVMASHGRESISPLRKTALIQEVDDRLWILSPLGDYLRRQPDREDGRRRSQRHVFGIARQHGSKVGAADGAAAAQRLRGELANLLSLTRDGLQQENRPEALDAAEVALALVPLLRFSGLGDVALLAQAAEVALRYGEVAAALRCYLGLADVMLARGDYKCAEDDYGRALTLCSGAEPSLDLRARALIGLGRVAAYRCEADAAERYYREALALSTEGGDQDVIAQARKFLGQAASEREEPEDAIKHYEECLRRFEALGEQREVANCQRSLAAQHLQADPSEAGRARARPLLDEALKSLTNAGDLRGQADCLRGQADLMLRGALSAEAEVYLQRASVLYDQIHDARGQSLAWYDLGRLSEAANQRDDACARYRCALKLLEGTESFRTLVAVYGALARVAAEPQQRTEFAELERATREKLNAKRSARHGDQPGS